MVAFARQSVMVTNLIGIVEVLLMVQKSGEPPGIYETLSVMG